MGWSRAQAAFQGGAGADPSTGSRALVEAERESVTILVAVVGPPRGHGRRSPDGSSAAHDRHVRLVQALLSGPTGREIAASGGGAGRVYDHWPDAMDAALDLLAQLDRLSAKPAPVELRIGLDLAGDETEVAVARHVGAIAQSAQPAEIRLGERLARLVERRPPDRLVVRPVVDPPSSAKAVHRLARARDEVPGNLVEAATSFVGRGAEVAALTGLLEAHRLLTVTGPPGTGKSRLAAEVASRVQGRYRDGAWFVALAPVGDPDLVMSAIAAALDIPVPPGLAPIRAMVAHLLDRRLLVVLDNFEHLLAARSQLVDLLAAAPDMHVLVTSQSSLQAPGEHEFVLAALDIPEPDAPAAPPSAAPSSAVDLFVVRATDALPSFRLRWENRALVTEICRRLDGLPLAIELAAARVPLLPLAAIAERLDIQLSVLGDDRDQTARHRSLQAAVGWSYDLLDPPSQRLFRGLSVFRGGWTFEAAVAVGGEEASGEQRSGDDAVLTGLATLQHASLLLRIDPESDAPRFTILETIRQFAAERLDEADEGDETRRRHADFCIDIAERASPRLTGPDAASALDELALDQDNLRAAIAWLMAANPVGAMRLGAAIWRFWQMRGHLVEGSRWMTDAIGAAEAAEPPASAEALASGHAAAGGLAYWRGDLAETERHYTRAVALRRALGDDVSIADALFDLAFVFDPSLRPPPEDLERTVAGIRVVEEAHALYLRSQHEPGIAKTEWLLGSVLANRDLDRAMDLLRSSVVRFRTMGDRFGLGWALHSYGLTLLRISDSDSAAGAFAEALELFAAAGDGSAIALLLDDVAEVAKAEGDALRHARLKGAAAGMRSSSEAELVVAGAPWLVGDTGPSGLIDPGALKQAWIDGRAMSQAEAIAFALRSPAAGPLDAGLRVSALGPLVVERLGQSVSDWGGPKAGNRHALAIFAFLMDRGERGVMKDEFIEVLWPDAEVEQGDLNFHRTLGGLRSTLAGRSAVGNGGEIVFASGRYRLAGAVVSWLDVAEFENLLLRAVEAGDELAAIRGLEAARLLYRGDYLDDCPLYGDSSYVEERRGLLRGRIVDALVDLGRRYAARSDESLASARYREALNVSGGNCPSASEGLRMLGVSEM